MPVMRAKVLISTFPLSPQTFKKFSTVSNYGLVLAGFLLFLMQMHGYLHTSSPDEFGFSKDNHIHHHIDLDEAKAKETEHDNL